MKDNSLDCKELDKAIESEINKNLADLKKLKIERTKIGDPQKLVDSISQIVWQQFILQIAGEAGQEFIKENGDLTLSLKREDHYLNPDKFTKGEMPSHNSKYSKQYQNRYDKWDNTFTDSEHTNLKPNYREPYDATRAKGSASMAKDHTIPVAEIIKDKNAATYLNQDEKINFANDTNINLKDLDSSANASKSDKTMRDWMESTRDGKHPDERFNINKEELLDRDNKARKEYDKKIEEGKNRAEIEGKESVKAEVTNALTHVGQAILLALLAKLTKTIFAELIKWLKEEKREMKTLLAHIKKAVVDFFFDFKNNLLLTAEVGITVLIAELLGAIFPIIKRACLFIIIGGVTVYKVGKYLADPNNRKKDTSVIILEIGKIVTIGLTSAGAIGLGIAITALLTKYVPILATIRIPLLGSIADLIGIFFGGLVAGICGAIVLHQIDGVLEGKLISENIAKQREVQKEILLLQDIQFNNYVEMVDKARTISVQNVKNDFADAKQQLEQIRNSLNEEQPSKHDDDLNNIDNLLNSVDW